MKKYKKTALRNTSLILLIVYSGWAQSSLLEGSEDIKKKTQESIQKNAQGVAVEGKLSENQVRLWLNSMGANSILPDGFSKLNTQMQGTKVKSILGHEALWINWNPTVNRYFSLIFKNKEQWESATFENPLSENSKVISKMDNEGVYSLLDQNGTHLCDIKQILEKSGLEKFKDQPYIPMCEGALWHKKTVRSYKSSVESATDLLRSTGSAGESVINVYKNLFGSKGEQAQEARDPNAHAISASSALVLNGAKNVDGIKVSTANLGITIKDHNEIVRGQIDSGRWYAAYYDEYQRRWAQLTVPQHLGVQGAGDDRLVYSMAFKIDQDVSLEYALGFDHPSLGWSSRPKIPRVGDGPDGFSDDRALVRTGVVAPWKMEKTFVVFAGGFKREHSAFRASEKSTTNNGHHYGMMEGGVVRSKIHPGLASVWGTTKGNVAIGSWGNSVLNASEYRFIRQNGLMLVENGVVSPHVDNLLAGNWSGNAQGDLLTMRSSFCLTKNNKQELIGVYSVFTLATPKLMAKTLVSLGCQNALQLDMNAPTLTYAAFVYNHPTSNNLMYEPLMKSMSEEKKTKYGRFISMSDSRDFFSLTQKVQK